MTRFEKKRVLVVDDNDRVREVLAYCLTNTGYDVCEACDGIDALDLLCKQRVEAVVTDYRMPRLNGLQLWAVSSKVWPGLPVILLSAAAAPEVLGLQPRQPFAWIRKPYDTTELLRVVRAACESASVPKGKDVFSPS